MKVSINIILILIIINLTIISSLPIIQPKTKNINFKINNPKIEKIIYKYLINDGNLIKINNSCLNNYKLKDTINFYLNIYILGLFILYLILYLLL